MSDFSLILKALRSDRGLSLRALAKQLGVTAAYIHQIESGESPAPRGERLAQLAKALDVDADMLTLWANRLPEDVACTFRELFKTKPSLLAELRAATTTPA